MGYRGIIFDFNGVLCWDTPMQIRAWDIYAQTLRGSRFSPQELQEHVIGRDNRHILAYISGRPFEGAELTRHSEAKETIYRQLCLDMGADFQLSPGAVPLLDELKRRGVRRSIATSAGKGNMLFYFEHLGLERWFCFDQIAYDDDHIRTKPAPDAYLLAAGRIGLPPSACAAVEDSEHGIQAALSAGIGCLIAQAPPEALSALSAIPGVCLSVENVGQIPVDELF